jgi:D-beta-D-heptose 7-phosphate kinase/D-beta-D-heptose 1-phosphate adenosyltransferase
MNKIILDWKKLNKKLDSLRKKNNKIVFTNGCFDIIHPGHIDYLKKAKALGDILVIGINSDSSIKRIKGAFRPINSENNRLKILEAFYFVDFLTIFNEDTPYNLIDLVKPDILVKGGDWNISEIVGKNIVEKYGGIVKIIPLLEGYSTSNIIDKILKNYSNEYCSNS